MHDWNGFGRGYNELQCAVQGYHNKLEAALLHWSKRPKTPRSLVGELIRVLVPTPRPEPAAIGHYSGPTIKAPRTTLVVTGGPNAKANGATLGLIMVAPLPPLAAKFGGMPQAVAADPGTVILLTAAVSAIGARLAVWYARRNRAPT